MAGVRGLRDRDPQQVGLVQLRAILGEGGQGTAYLGEGPDGRQVAVKLLHAHLVDDPAAQERFLREVQIATRVAPFCTAQVLATGLHGDRPYIISEYVPGVTLVESVAQDGPRVGGSLDRLAIATATALAAIHRAGVLHRDFKPDNVIVGADGPVVIDFGIARALDSGARVTATGNLVGTPAYMAPEQIDDLEAGPAADIWAWACTIVFAATGSSPFQATGMHAIFRKVLDDEPDLGALRPPLSGIVSACLNKDPARRPTAEQLITMLTGNQTTAPTAPGAPVPVNGPPVPQGVASEQPLWAATTQPPPSYAQPAAVTFAGPSRRVRWWIPAAAAAAVVLVGAGTYAVAATQGSGRAAAAGSPAASSTGTRPPGVQPSATSPLDAGAQPSASRSSSGPSPTSSKTPSPNSLPPGAYGPNLVVNGSFATGSLSPWTMTCCSVVVSSGAYSGTYAVQMHSGGGGAGIQQWIYGLKIGQQYELTGWSRSVDGVQSMVGVRHYDPAHDGGIMQFTTGNTWYPIRIIFTPVVAKAMVWCWVGSGPSGTGLCDDITLRAYR